MKIINVAILMPNSCLQVFSGNIALLKSSILSSNIVILTKMRGGIKDVAFCNKPSHQLDSAIFKRVFTLPQDTTVPQSMNKSVVKP